MSFQALFAMSGVVVVLFSSLFLCSCAPKKPTQAQNTSISTADPLVPLGFRCIEKHVCSQQDGSLLITRYAGNQPRERAIAFYRREMEAAGWDLSNFSNDQEGLFFCRKGQQECAVAISSKGKTVITLSYKIKTPIAKSLATDTALINKPLPARAALEHV